MAQGRGGERERRASSGAEVRLLAGTNGGPGRLKGYAAAFNTLSESFGRFREKIAPGCFADCLRSGADVLCFYGHNTEMVLGRKSAGTLQVWEDAHGLGFEVSLPDTQAARDLAASVRRGDVKGASFAFTCQEDEWNWAGEERIRTVKKAILHEVSPTSIPAYPDTTVAIRRGLAAYGADRSVSGMRAALLEKDRAIQDGLKRLAGMQGETWEDDA